LVCQFQNNEKRSKHPLAQFWYDFKFGEINKLPSGVMGSKDLRSGMISVGFNPLRIDDNVNAGDWSVLSLGEMSGRTEILWAQRNLRIENFSYTNGGGGIAFCSQNIESANQCYYFAYGSGSSFTSIRLFIRNSSSSQSTIGSIPPDLSYTRGKIRYSRILRDNDIIKVRSWVEGSTEPSSWNVETVDTSFQDGYYGILHQGGYGGLIDYLYVSVGTDGDLPPTEPPTEEISSISGIITDRFGNPCQRKVYAVSRSNDTDTPEILDHVLSDSITGEYNLSVPSKYGEITRVVVSEDDSPLLNDIVDRVIPG
jgi:hypothetical protein